MPTPSSTMPEPTMPEPVMPDAAKDRVRVLVLEAVAPAPTHRRRLTVAAVAGVALVGAGATAVGAMNTVFAPDPEDIEVLEERLDPPGPEVGLQPLRGQSILCAGSTYVFEASVDVSMDRPVEAAQLEAACRNSDMAIQEDDRGLPAGPPRYCEVPGRAAADGLPASPAGPGLAFGVAACEDATTSFGMPGEPEDRRPVGWTAAPGGVEGLVDLMNQRRALEIEVTAAPAEDPDCPQQAELEAWVDDHLDELEAAGLTRVDIPEDPGAVCWGVGLDWLGGMVSVSGTQYRVAPGDVDPDAVNPGEAPVPTVSIVG